MTIVIDASVAGKWFVKRPTESRPLEVRLRYPNCLYLACTERTGLRLVTADRRLLAALAGSDLSALAVPVDDFAA